MESSQRNTPDGLFVTLDRLDYAFQPVLAPPGQPHLFTYHLTIHNASATGITILARKWIITAADGRIDVIEGDKVVGQTPVLPPGTSFSYASFHLTHTHATAKGAFHGVSEAGAPVSVPIPEIRLSIPGEAACN